MRNFMIPNERFQEPYLEKLTCRLYDEGQIGKGKNFYYRLGDTFIFQYRDFGHGESSCVSKNQHVSYECEIEEDSGLKTCRDYGYHNPTRVTCTISRSKACVDLVGHSCNWINDN